MALPLVLLGARALLGKVATSSLARSAVSQGARLLGGAKKRNIAQSVASKLTNGKKCTAKKRAQAAQIADRMVDTANTFAKKSNVNKVLDDLLPI